MAKEKKTVLVFTGGGLAPALNPTLFGVITEAQKRGMRIIGGLRGWGCLLGDGKVIDLTDFNPAPLKMSGGTMLRSSRTNPFNIEGGIPVLKKRLADLKINYIIAIGGDDTLGAAHRLFIEEGIPVVGIPKTIDNDLQQTYWTPGYPSAAYYMAKFCYEVKIDAAYALSRIFVIEVLGRKSGWLAAAGVYGNADIIIPPEGPADLERMLSVLKERYKENGNYATVVISEEAQWGEDIIGMNQDQDDGFGVQRRNFVALVLRKIIKNRLGIECKALFPGNYVQTGMPIPIDASVAVQLGTQGIEMLEKEQYGYMACVQRPSLSSDIITAVVSLEKAVGKVRVLDPDYYDAAKFLPTEAFRSYAAPFFVNADFRNSDYQSIVQKFSKE